MFRIFFSYIFSIQLNSFFILGIEHVDITKEADSSTFFFHSKESIFRYSDKWNLQWFQVPTTVLVCEHSMGFLFPHPSLLPSSFFLTCKNWNCKNFVKSNKCCEIAVSDLAFLCDAVKRLLCEKIMLPLPKSATDMLWKFLCL